LRADPVAGEQGRLLLACCPADCLRGRLGRVASGAPAERTRTGHMAGRPVRSPAFLRAHCAVLPAAWLPQSAAANCALCRSIARRNPAADSPAGGLPAASALAAAAATSLCCVVLAAAGRLAE